MKICRVIHITTLHTSTTFMHTTFLQNVLPGQVVMILDDGESNHGSTAKLVVTSEQKVGWILDYALEDLDFQPYAKEFT